MSRRTSAALARLGGGELSDPKDSRALRPDALPALRERAAAAPAGRDVAPAAIGRAAEELHGLAHDAAALTSRMLQAGRRLLRLRRDLGHGACRALIRAELVPFGEAMASRLRTVAEAVEDRRIREAALPRALGPAYALARLPTPQAARLLEAGLVRPDVAEREVRDAIRPVPGDAAGERRRLERRLATIAATVARLEAEAAGIRARLAEA